MKDKKKIIICAVVAAAILAVGVLAGVLIGKRSADKKEETESSTISTTTTTTTTEASTTTTEMPTSTEKAVSVTVVDGVISNTDRNNFSRILGNILFFDFDAVNPPNADDYTALEYEKAFYKHNYKPYDYKSADAKRYAYNRLLTGYNPLTEDLTELYDLYSFQIDEVWKESEEDDTFEADPKGLLGEFYCIADGEYIDICLETVFNVRPDHNYVLKSKDGEVYAYYYNGDYYYRGDEGGGGTGPEIFINDIKIMNDGKYSINATYYVTGPEEKEKIYDVNIVAEMKKVEGKSLWSFYKIEKA